MSETELRLLLREDFTLYAEKLLKIRTKSGAILPFVLNRAQLYIHSRLEEQRQKTGRVRALILKGRQQGCSTLIGGRYYHRTTHNTGYRTFILAHEAEASNNLFEMAKRYHEHMHPAFQPSVAASNAKELVFDKLDSGYKVGTAGNKGTGRSATVQLFHGSEVAFWPNAKEHAAGVLQAVPNAPDTEVILESTANGMGNYFHKMWLKAQAGLSEFIAIFVPWYWQDEYSLPVEGRVVLTDEEEKYKTLYGLTDGQMLWRRAKIEELGDEALFRQEYPATPDEAFQFSATESFIKPDLVMRARKNASARGHGPIIAGVDSAWFGDDRTTFILRQGRVAFNYESYTKWDTTRTLGRCLQLLNDPALPVHRLYLDVSIVGASVYDLLIERGYGSRVRIVNFGSGAQEARDYANRRAEMWDRMKEWLEDPVGVSIPDSDELQADLTAPGYRYNSRTQLLIESKEDIKARGLPSTDGADALCVTFADMIEQAAETGPVWANGTPYKGPRG